MLDYLKALGVGFAVLLITLAASYPMVTFYAYFVEPGYSQDFYVAAAQWIAPWSSHILGPLIFFVFNYWMAKRVAKRNAIMFAVATIVFYIIVDLGMLPFVGAPITVGLNLTSGLSLIVKIFGALLGAYFGSRSRRQSGEAA